VENAIRDDELGAAISTIRAKGAFVFAVFDSCHSGTVTRGAPAGDDYRERDVDPEILGIPPNFLDAAPDASEEPIDAGAGEAGEGMGGLVVFSAAQSTETTPEMRLPAGRPGRQSHGLFSFTLLQALAEHPGITYRQAAQEVLHRYAAGHISRPTPLFEGDLDRPVMNLAASEPVSQWPLDVSGDAPRIPAGALNGLTQGSVLLVLPGPAAAADEALGRAVIAESEALESRLELDLPAGVAIPSQAWVRLEERRLDFRLVVARPSEETAQLEALLDGLDTDGDETGLHLSWVVPGEPADIRLSQRDGRLWLLPPTGELVTEGPERTPSVGIADKSMAEAQDALLDDFIRIARVTSLLRIGTVSASGADGFAATLRVKRTGGGLEDIDPSRVPEIHPGDEVHIDARNEGAKPVDVVVLFIGSDFSISQMYAERIHPGGELKAGLFGVTDSSFGREQVLVVASPAEEMTELLDLRFLEQRALPLSRGSGGGLREMLRQADLSLDTRGAAPLAASGGNADPAPRILHFSVETRPR
jgi:hypothetical protein